MSQSPNSPHPDRDPQRAGGKRRAARKPYTPPVLVEYGSAAKLTQGALTIMSEGVGFSMMMCL